MSGIGFDQIVVEDLDVFFFDFIHDLIVKTALLQETAAVNKQDTVSVSDQFRGEFCQGVLSEVNLRCVLE